MCVGTIVSALELVNNWKKQEDKIGIFSGHSTRHADDSKVNQGISSSILACFVTKVSNGPQEASTTSCQRPILHHYIVAATDTTIELIIDNQSIVNLHLVLIKTRGHVCSMNFVNYEPI